MVKSGWDFYADESDLFDSWLDQCCATKETDDRDFFTVGADLLRSYNQFADPSGKTKRTQTWLNKRLNACLCARPPIMRSRGFDSWDIHGTITATAYTYFGIYATVDAKVTVRLNGQMMHIVQELATEMEGSHAQVVRLLCKEALVHRGVAF